MSTSIRHHKLIFSSFALVCFTLALAHCGDVAHAQPASDAAPEASVAAPAPAVEEPKPAEPTPAAQPAPQPEPEPVAVADAAPEVDAGPAEAPAATSQVAVTLDDILKMVFSVLGLLAAWLVTKLLGVIKKKTKIEVSQSVEAMIDGWVQKGVNYAQEKSHQKLQASGEKLKGGEKMEAALKYVNDMIDQHGLDKVAEEKLKTLVEARLGKTREGA